MIRRGSIRLTAVAVAAVALTLAASEVANAGWGSWGSHGSWGGSRGYYSGGSHGWHGSRGFGSSGGVRRPLFPRLRAFLSGSWGSRGRAWHSHGSSGGSWGSSGGYRYYSSFGSSGGGYVYSYGSSGGSRGSAYYSQPTLEPGTGYGTQPNAGGEGGMIMPGPADPSTENQPQPSGGDSGEQAEPNNTTSTLDAILQVSLPAKAKVYVNGNLTTTPGSVRKYVSRNLKPGRDYSYQVRAVMPDQRALTQVVDLRAGQQKEIAFNFNRATESLTSVTVHVPEEAEVTLAGRRTAARGNVRSFSTDALQPGEKWANYRVEVTYPVNGKLVTRSKSIDVVGGQSHEIRFDPSDKKVAAR